MRYIPTLYFSYPQNENYKIFISLCLDKNKNRKKQQEYCTLRDKYIAPIKIKLLCIKI